MTAKKIFDWRETLKEFLIDAGTDGRGQTEIVAKLNGYANAEAIRNELEALHLQDKVQRFDVSQPEGLSGRNKTVWRATTKMVED